MRRLAATHAKPGMVLAKDVVDSRGYALLPAGALLDEDSLTTLLIHRVWEISVEDPRVSDVGVQPLFPPELEAKAADDLLQLLQESPPGGAIEEVLLDEVRNSVYALGRALFPTPFWGLGDPNVSGCLSIDDYKHVQPIKTAGLSILLSKMEGLGIAEAVDIGIAAALKDVGYILWPEAATDRHEPLYGLESVEIQQHTLQGAKFLGQYGQVGPEVAEAILQHHEHWDGSGFPDGLKGEDVRLGARTIGLTDTYYQLVSPRPHRPAFMPHEAAEYIMGCRGELFDPQIVQLFARGIPLFPAGVAVQLNTGEQAIVSRSNSGHVGRPIVRICANKAGKAIASPYDIDLSEPEYQGVMIGQVLEY